MPRPKKKTELETAAAISLEVAQDNAEELPAEDPKDPKKGKEYKSLTTRLASERLRRLKHQNSKLSLELKKLRGQVGDIDKFKREVLAANQVVKQQILAVGPRLAPQLASISDPRELGRLLTEALVEALNDLAYERENTNG